MLRWKTVVEKMAFQETKREKEREAPNTKFKKLNKTS